MLERLKAFGRRCVGKVGCFLGHPAMVRLVVLVVGSVLGWCLKLLIIALLSSAGIALPVG